jgi:hypothetical protein
MTSKPDPYEAPVAQSSSEVRSPWMLVLAALGAGLGGPLVGTLLLGAPEPGDMVGLVVMAAGPPVGVVLGLAAMGRAWQTRSALAGTVGALSGALFGLVAASMAYSVLYARGRQLREQGELKLPPVEPGEGWAARAERILLPDAVRSGVAAAWRENGRTEHASVAAFARTSLELVALGAPPELLVDAARDAVDEIRHTEACFGLARALDGVPLSPGPFPEASTAGTLRGDRGSRLAELAVVSLVDGALHEGVSARVISRLVERCEVPAIREVLQALASDEERHARHAWDVVDFCLQQGGEPVARALREGASRIPATIRSPHLKGAEDGDWERYGLPGRALEQQEYTEALGHLRAELEQRLALITPRGPEPSRRLPSAASRRPPPAERRA